MSVCLIVGAGDYIGAAIARRFAAEGFTVAMGRRNGDKLAPLIAEIEAGGGLANGYSMDARAEESVEQVFAEVERDLGPIDLVVFNVGGNVRFALTDTTERVFRKVWEMACKSGFLTGRAAARHMLPRGRGKIFLTGASASMRGNPGFAAFGAAKAGLRSLAQTMAKELGPKGIHVAHLVIDGGVDTEWVRDLYAKSGRDPDTMPENSLLDPDSVAEAYWALWQQTPDAWTFEMDLRPFAETW